MKSLFYFFLHFSREVDSLLFGGVGRWGVSKDKETIETCEIHLKKTELESVHSAFAKVLHLNLWLRVPGWALRRLKVRALLLGEHGDLGSHLPGSTLPTTPPTFPGSSMSSICVFSRMRSWPFKMAIVISSQVNLSTG